MALLNVASSWAGTGGPQGFGLADPVVMVHTATATYDVESTVQFLVPKPQGTKLKGAVASINKATLGTGAYSMVKNVKIDDTNSKVTIELGTGVVTNDTITVIAFVGN